MRPEPVEPADLPHRLIVLTQPDPRLSVDYTRSVQGVLNIRPLRPNLNAARLSLTPNANPQNIPQTSELISRTYLVDLSVDSDPRLVAAELERHPGIILAEPDYAIHILDQSGDADQSPVIPDDLQFTSQWYLNNSGELEGAKPGADISATKAWSIFTGNPDFVVAVIDTGIDFFHPDLESNVWINPDEIPGNGLDDDKNGFVDDIHGYDFQSNDSDPYDDNGHGTHVSGILGASGNNESGIAGVVWSVQMMGLKTFDERGNGNISRAIDAIEYAVANKARIINASWSTDEKSRVLEQVILAARNDGVLTIAAAGNDRSQNPSYPAHFDSVISVAALDIADNKSDFSNFGPTVDIAAPGTGIFSTKINNTFGSLNGTSMAAPIVAGVAALIWGNNPQFSLLDVENILLSTADPLETKEEIGAGRVNAYKAIQVTEPIPTARLLIPIEVSGDLDIYGSASGDTLVEYILEIGSGFQPSSWEVIHRSSTPVESGLLLPRFSTGNLNEGEYSIRLRARNSQGLEGFSQRRIVVNNVEIVSPGNNDFLAHGSTLPIMGSVFGLSRTYHLEWGQGIEPVEWTQSGISVPDYQPGTIQNSVLGLWDTSLIEPRKFYALRLTSQTASDQIDTHTSWLLYMDPLMNDGWPQFIPVPDTIDNSLDWKNVKSSDLDGDGDREVLFIQPGDEDLQPTKLVVADHSGRILWSQPLAAGRPFGGSIVTGQLNEDPAEEIIVEGGGDGRVYAFTASGNPLGHSWPVNPPGSNFGLVLADLDQDGSNELITFNNEAFFPGNRPTRRLSVFSNKGLLIKSWDFDDCFHDQDVVQILPAVANLDSDPDLEIIVPNGCSGLQAIDYSQVNNPIWSVSVNGHILTSPVIGDLNADSHLEIIVSAFDPEKSNRGGVYAFSSEGVRFGSFPVLLGDSFLDAPILADIDNDRDLEIIVNSRLKKQIHVLNHDGFNKPGWPTKPLHNEFFRGQPTVGDLNGDGLLEILAPIHGVFLLFANTGDPTFLGGIRVYDPNGQTIPDPISRSKNWLAIPSAGGSIIDKNHLIQLTDLDGDGLLDILLSSVDDMAYVPNNPSLIRKKNTFSIYTWELNIPYQSGLFPWPNYQADNQQSGYFDNPPKPNRLPVVNRIPNQVAATAQQWLPVNLRLFISDPDHDFKELFITVATSQAVISQISEDGFLSISPLDPLFQGTAELEILVRDPRNGTATRTLRFTANESLVFPFANPDLIQTPEDTQIVFPILQNDTDPSGGQLLLLSAGPANHGAVSINPDRTINYLPSLNYFGPDSFNYTILGSSGGQSVGFVSIEVSPVNDPPLVADDYAILDEDSKVTLNPLANDSDPENDPIQLASIDTPSHGSLSQNGDGSFSYVPDKNFFGEEIVQYTVRDQHGAISAGKIILVIQPINDIPIANDLNLDMNRNTVRSIIFSAVDVDGDDLKYEVVQPPENGELLVFPTVAEYAPKDGFIGVDNFTYIAKDAFSQSVEATVTIRVLDRNNPPKAISGNAFTLINQSIDIELQADDPDNDPFTIIIDQFPQNGNLVPGESENMFIYEPSLDFVGEDSFSFHARDNLNDGPTATFRIRVTDENTPPRALDQFISTRMGVPVAFDLDVFDREGTPLLVNALELPNSGTLNLTNTSALYTPFPDFLGIDKFVYLVSDGVTDSRRATVFFNVRFPNDEPIVTQKKIVLLRGQSFSFDLPVLDPDGDILRSAIVKGPKNGRVFGDGIRYTYRPTSSFIGDDSFTFRSWDGLTYGDLGLVEIEVRATPIDIALTISDFVISSSDRYLIEISATNGLFLALDYSTDLISWNQIQQVEVVNRQAKFSGAIPRINPNSSINPSGFFRIRAVSSKSP